MELSRAPPGSASADAGSAPKRDLTSSQFDLFGQSGQTAPEARREVVSKADGRALLQALDQLRDALKNGLAPRYLLLLLLYSRYRS